MDRGVAVRIEGVSKRYEIGALQRHTTIREHAVHLAGAPIRFLRDPHRRAEGARSTIWAVDDVSLDVRQGDVLGIVGRNGAGKSTLLKILSRITDPTRGRIEIHGRVGSLLEVGTGFHGELSGRENIFLNGAILGMRKAEIKRKFDDIVAFSEIGEFIDTPVKRYSSGMYVRLAFGVAAHLEPEILIVDEVLAVGDAAFQKKCIGKMGDVARSGRTVLFVSHNMGAVAELCTRAVLLEKGRNVAEGSVTHVLEEYSRVLGGVGHETDFADDVTKPASLLACRVEHSDGTSSASFDLTDEFALTVRYVVREPLRSLQLTLTLARNMIDLVHTFDTDSLSEIPVRAPGIYEARCVVPGSFFKAGLYTTRLTLGTPEWLIQEVQSAVTFEIEELTINTQIKGYRKDRPGHVIAPVEWETARVAPLEAETHATA